MARGATRLWRRLDIPGHELADVWRSGDAWLLSGVALLLHEGRPCRVDYTIRCRADWTTERAIVHARVGSRVTTLAIERTLAGEWRIDHAPADHLAGCDDVDRGFSPSTNLLPIRRLSLGIGEGAPVRAAWVRFPELSLEVLEQHYTRTGEQTYRYESAGGAFRRELIVDDTGLVIDYPGVWIAERSLGADGEPRHR